MYLALNLNWRISDVNGSLLDRAPVLRLMPWQKLVWLTVVLVKKFVCSFCLRSQKNTEPTNISHNIPWPSPWIPRGQNQKFGNVPTRGKYSQVQFPSADPMMSHSIKYPLSVPSRGVEESGSENEINRWLPRGLPWKTCKKPLFAFIQEPVLTAVGNDLLFTEDLMSKKSVFCLPGTVFECANYFRIVLTVPETEVKEALRRIAEYCEGVVLKSWWKPELKNSSWDSLSSEFYLLSPLLSCHSKVLSWDHLFMGFLTTIIYQVLSWLMDFLD